MQGQGGKQLYSGPMDAVAKLYKEGGLKSIYRGTGATVARDGPGSAACASLSPRSRSSSYVLLPHNGLHPLRSEADAVTLPRRLCRVRDGQEVAHAGRAGPGCALAQRRHDRRWLGRCCHVDPRHSARCTSERSLDSGRVDRADEPHLARPQVVKSRLQGAPEGTYKGFMDCARQTVAKDGVGALFKGFGPAMARVRLSLLDPFAGSSATLSLLPLGSTLSPLVTDTSPCRAGLPRQRRHLRASPSPPVDGPSSSSLIR